MKANKFFAVALAALTLVGFNACQPKEPEEKKLALNESAISVAVAATFQLTANMDVIWASANPEVAAVNDKGLVQGIAAGETNITATATDGQKAVCKVTVTAGGVVPPPAGDTYAEFPQLQGSAYYVFFLQGGAMDYLGNKVLYSFGPNDHPDETAGAGKRQGSRWLYSWAETFVGGEAVGTDPFDLAEGWLCMSQVTGGTWAGFGLCVAINDDNNKSGEGADDDLAALNKIKDNITNYDEWYLAVALKNSTQGAAYTFSIIGSNVYSEAEGKGVESGIGQIKITPAATGEWIYKEYKLSDIPGLEFGEFTTNGSNILTVLAEPYMSGAQLNLGYAFIYKK